MFFTQYAKNKKKKKITFFDFLERKYDFLRLMEHFINIFVTKWIKKKKKNRIFFLLFLTFLTFWSDNVTFWGWCDFLG